MTRPHIAIVNQNLALEHDLRPRREAETLAAAGYDVTLVGGCHSVASARRAVDASVRLELYSQPKVGAGVLGQMREQSQAMLRAVAAVIRVSRRRPIAALHAGNPPDNFFLMAPTIRPLQGCTPRFVYDHTTRLRHCSQKSFPIRFSRSHC